MKIEITRHDLDIVLLALENYEDMAKELLSDDSFPNEIHALAEKLKG